MKGSRQEILPDIVLEENTLYFIRLVGNEHIKNMCMINYNPKLNPNWDCKICTFINSYKDRCEMCNTPKPRFRSYRKKLGKTKDLNHVQSDQNLYIKRKKQGFYT